MTTESQKTSKISCQYKDELNVRIWEKIIDVQKHFNEIKSKNQTLFISILTACLAGTGYLMINKELANKILHLNFAQIHLNFYVYSIPILGAIIFSICFYLLDNSYHILLKGAVECGIKFENETLGMELTSNEIKKMSAKHALSIFDVKIGGTGLKHKLFYGIIILVLFILFLILNSQPSSPH